MIFFIFSLQWLLGASGILESACPIPCDPQKYTWWMPNEPKANCSSVYFVGSKITGSQNAGTKCSAYCYGGEWQVRPKADRSKNFKVYCCNPNEPSPFPCGAGGTLSIGSTNDPDTWVCTDPTCPGKMEANNNYCFICNDPNCPGTMVIDSGKWRCLDLTCNGEMVYDPSKEEYNCKVNEVKKDDKGWSIFLYIVLFLVGFGAGYLVKRQFQAMLKTREQQLSMLQNTQDSSTQYHTNQHVQYPHNKYAQYPQNQNAQHYQTPQVQNPHNQNIQYIQNQNQNIQHSETQDAQHSQK